MSSILNSISAGDLQVPQVPGDKSAKSDSVEILMTNPKTKFENCPINDGFDITNTGFGEGNTLHLTPFCKKPKTKTPYVKVNGTSVYSKDIIINSSTIKIGFCSFSCFIDTDTNTVIDPSKAIINL